MRHRKRLAALALLFIGFIYSSLAADDKSARPAVDWEKTLTAWGQYLELPSSENAKVVFACLPDHGHIKYSNTAEETKALDSIAGELRMLERQILSSDREALKVAFRLYTLADGAFGEELDIIIGELIRINPELFLDELNENRKLVIGLDGLVGNLGDEYVDREKAAELEVSLRIQALQKVTKASLVSIRDECISVLENR